MLRKPAYADSEISRLRLFYGEGDFDKAIVEATGLKPSWLGERMISRFR